MEGGPNDGLVAGVGLPGGEKKSFNFTVDFNMFNFFLSSSVSKITNMFSSFIFRWIIFIECKYFITSISCFIMC